MSVNSKPATSPFEPFQAGTESTMTSTMSSAPTLVLLQVWMAGTTVALLSVESVSIASRSMLVCGSGVAVGATVGGAVAVAVLVAVAVAVWVAAAV